MLAAPIVNPVVLASTYLAFRGSFTMVLARVALAVLTAALLGLYARRLNDVFLTTNESGDHDHMCHHHHFI